MPRSETERGPRSGADGTNRDSQVGSTRQLLRTIHQEASSTHERLYEEVERINPGKQHDPSELVELSVKLSTRGFFGRRHGACVSWERSDRGQLADSASQAAPSEVLRKAFARSARDLRERSADSADAVDSASDRATSGPSSAEERAAQALQAWAARSSRFHSAIAYDFDAGLYKLYLFKHHPVQFFEDLDLVTQRSDLPALSYIRSLEVAIEDPTQWKEALYFKLGFALPPSGDTADASPTLVRRRSPLDVLAADFRPHRLMSPRLLHGVKNRPAAVKSLTELLADLPVINDPVVKLTPPRMDPADPQRDRAESAWADTDYGLNLNLLDPAKTRFVEDYDAAIVGLAESLGCEQQVKAWLKRIAPFDCMLSYLGLGSDSVTLYYRSTALHRRKPAARFARARRKTEEKGNP